MQTAHRFGLFSQMLIPKSLAELNYIPESTFLHEWNCKYLFTNMEQDYKISCDQKLFKIVFQDCVIFTARLESEVFQFWIVDGYMYDFTVKKKSSDGKYTVSIVLHGRNTKHDATPLQLTSKGYCFDKNNRKNYIIFPNMDTIHLGNNKIFLGTNCRDGGKIYI